MTEPAENQGATAVADGGQQNPEHETTLDHLAQLAQTVTSGYVNGYGSITLKLSDNSTLLVTPSTLVDWFGNPQFSPTNPGSVTAGPVDLPVLIAGVAQTVTANSPDQTNVNGKGVKVVINMTAFGTGSVTVSIQGKDPASGAYYTILASPAIVANGVTTLTVYPGIAVVANVSASDVLPKVWRVVATSNNANPTTFTIGATVLP